MVIRSRLIRYSQALRWRLLRWKYRHSAFTGRFDWDWVQTPYDRVALVSRLVCSYNLTRYLEIGCRHDTLFRAVGCQHKVGVDPHSGGTHRMTSDEFFAICTDEYDLVFVDGLHEHEQVWRDVSNALQHVPVGGFIVIHDLLPRTWQEQHVPRLQQAWTGDVWKVAFDILETPGLGFEIVLVDHGLGVVRKLEAGVALGRSSACRRSAGFPYLYENIGRLPLVSWKTWVAR